MLSVAEFPRQQCRAYGAGELGIRVVMDLKVKLFGEHMPENVRIGNTAGKQELILNGDSAGKVLNTLGDGAQNPCGNRPFLSPLSQQ